VADILEFDEVNKAVAIVKMELKGIMKEHNTGIKGAMRILNAEVDSIRKELDTLERDLTRHSGNETDGFAEEELIRINNLKQRLRPFELGVEKLKDLIYLKGELK
jgi:hypothetical protein